jgi:hypothetical protein
VNSALNVFFVLALLLGFIAIVVGVLVWLDREYEWGLAEHLRALADRLFGK